MTANSKSLRHRQRVASFGIDLERVGATEPVVSRVRRRLGGRYPVDAFGGDPLLQDGAARSLARLMSVDVTGAAAVPEIGPAVIVVNRRPGPGDVAATAMAVREARRRRPRVVGYPEVPGIGMLARRLGAVRMRGDDVGVLLRHGHLVVVPLRPSLRPGRAGSASVGVMGGAVGFPILPAAVTGGVGVVSGLPVGSYRLSIGAPLTVEGVQHDPLSAAELAEAARVSVQALLDAGALEA